MRLPSFDGPPFLPHAPIAITLLKDSAGSGTGDACSASHWGYSDIGGAETQADRNVDFVDVRYVRRILIEIISGEEYPAFSEFHQRLNKQRDNVDPNDDLTAWFKEIRRAHEMSKQGRVDQDSATESQEEPKCECTSESCDNCPICDCDWDVVDCDLDPDTQKLLQARTAPDRPPEIRLTDLRLASEFSPASLRPLLDELWSLDVAAAPEDIRRWKSERLSRFTPTGILDDGAYARLNARFVFETLRRVRNEWWAEQHRHYCRTHCRPPCQRQQGTESRSYEEVFAEFMRRGWPQRVITLSRYIRMTDTTLVRTVMREGIRRPDGTSITFYHQEGRPLEGEERQTETTRVQAISFIAAALLLLYDLDHDYGEDGGKESKRTRRDTIVDLHKNLSSLSRTLNRISEDVAGLVHPRPRGRPKTSPRDSYRALHLHRMGLHHKTWAPAFGITLSHRSDDWQGQQKGSKSLDGLRRKLRLGLDYERDHLPDVLEVFTSRADPEIQERAIREYRRWDEELDAATHVTDYVDLDGSYTYGQTIDETTTFREDALLLDLSGEYIDDEYHDLRRAFIQLGASLIFEIDDPLAPTLENRGDHYAYRARTLTND